MLVDWLTWFLPAIARFGAGGSPYADTGIFNPIWTFWLLTPIQSFTEPAKTLAGFLLPYAVLTFVAWRLKQPVLIPLVGLSYPFLQMAYIGNVDWLVLFGLVSVNHWSPFFLLIKPQASALVMLAWIKKHGWRIFIPVAIALLFNALLYPDWINNLLHVHTGSIKNYSLFPYGLIVGLPLAYRAYRNESPLCGAIATLFCSPYFLIYSFVPTLTLLAIKHKRMTIAANVFFWWFFVVVNL